HQFRERPLRGIEERWWFGPRGRLQPGAAGPARRRCRRASDQANDHWYRQRPANRRGPRFPAEGRTPRGWSPPRVSPAAGRLWLIEPCDEGIEELAQRRRPFGVLRPARRVAEFAVDLEIARLYACGGKIPHHLRGDRRREEAIGAAQYIQDLRLDLREVLHRVGSQAAHAQDTQRVRVPGLGLVRRLFAYLGLPRFAVGVARGERRLDAVAFQHLDPELGQNRLGTARVIVPAAVPFGIGRKPRLQFGEVLFDI